MKAKLSKKQIFNNAERDFNNYQRIHANLLESHEQYRKEYGTDETEANFRKQEDFSKKKLNDLKKRFEKAKLGVE